MAMASINIPGMSNLADALDSAASELPYDQFGFRSILARVSVDSSPAVGIGTVAAWVEQQIPGIKRRLALAQFIEAQKPGFQDTVSIDEGQLSNLDPSVAQQLGADDAKKLKDSGGKLDPVLIAEIAKYQNDPYFAAAFAQNIPPSDLADVVIGASNGRDALAAYGGSPDYQQRLADWQKQYGDLLSVLGNTVATATRNTGDLALPAGYGDEWVKTITADVPSNGGDGRYGQAAALSLLLRNGSYGTDFLDTVASGVYDYERSSDQDGMWRSRAWVGSDFEGVYAPDGSQVSDPMAGVMSALGHNPVAAQQFFDGGGKTATIEINGQKVPVNDRLKYLIQDRTWAKDIGSDNGAGLGAALEAASTYFRDDSVQGQLSAKIAGESFALIGDKTGDGQSDGGLFGIGSHQGWKMWDGMRVHVANMVASYAPDLIRVAGVRQTTATEWGGSWNVSDPSNSLFPPHGPASAWLDPTLMQKIIGTLGEDPKNMDIVNTGIAAAGRVMLDYAAQRGLLTDPDAAAHVIAGDRTVPSLTGAAGALAYTLNFAISAGYHGDKSKQEFDKQRAENISKVLGLVTSVPGLEIPEGHAWTGFLIDQLKDQALDKIGEGPDQDAQDTYNDTSADYQGKLAQMTLNSLLSNGYLSDGQYAKANTPGAPHEFLSPLASKYADQDPPAVSYDQNGTPHFNFDSQAYHDWEQDGQALNTWLQNNVTDPFRSNLPAYGG